MKSRHLVRLIGTDTLVDCSAAVNLHGWSCIGGKVIECDDRGYFLVSGEWRDEDGPRGGNWYAMARDIRLHVPAKKAPEAGSAEQPNPAPTFQVGDVVDCDGSVAHGCSDAKCAGGKIVRDDGSSCPYLVTGEWTLDGKPLEGWQRDGLWCRPDQVRHHVAKEEAKAVQFPDKMEKREGFKYEQMPHVVPIAANIRDAIEAMKRVKTMAEIEIGRLESLLDNPSKPTKT